MGLFTVWISGFVDDAAVRTLGTPFGSFEEFWRTKVAYIGEKIPFGSRFEPVLTIVCRTTVSEFIYYS